MCNSSQWPQSCRASSQILSLDPYEKEIPFINLWDRKSHALAVKKRIMSFIRLKLVST